MAVTFARWRAASSKHAVTISQRTLGSPHGIKHDDLLMRQPAWNPQSDYGGAVTHR